MNWLVASTTGFGLGITYFGGLWLTLRSAPRLMVWSRLGRLAWAAFALTQILQVGGGKAIGPAIAGLFLAKLYLICTLGGIGRDR